MRDIWIKRRLYMRRIPLLTLPFFGIRLHGIRLPDMQRDLHNHPFKWWVAIVLSGGYVELRADGYRVYQSVWGWLRDRTATCVNSMRGPGAYHRIETVRSNTWTLFVHGPRIARWGFLVRGVHVDAAEYRDPLTGARLSEDE